MTLTDLYNQLDWSHVKANPDRWYNLYTTIKDKPLVDEDFFRRFWCNIIYVALFRGTDNDEDKGFQRTAIEALVRAGMWDKVVDVIKKAGLINEPKNENDSSCVSPVQDKPDAPLHGTEIQGASDVH